jgi:dolichyl-phosphate beta-glucosyltransferase
LNNKGYKYEIIVVDDGSSDDTVAIAKAFGGNVSVLSQSSNMGKGAAVRRGMLTATGDIRIFTDADFSTPIYEIEKILPKIEAGADICIGSRALDPSMIKEHQPFYREFMGKTFNQFVQVLFFKGISDTQCGFKGFTRAAAEKIFLKAKINGFSFDVELLYLASKAGLRVEQVSVEWYNDARSKVNPVKDSLMMLIELFRIKRIHR